MIPDTTAWRVAPRRSDTQEMPIKKHFHSSVFDAAREIQRGGRRQKVGGEGRRQGQGQEGGAGGGRRDSQ